MKKIWMKLSIRLKFAFFTISLIILLQLFNSIVLINTETNSLLDDIWFNAELYAEYNSRGIIENYLKYYISERDEFLKFIEKISMQNNEIENIYIYDSKGKMLVSQQMLRRKPPREIENINIPSDRDKDFFWSESLRKDRQPVKQKNIEIGSILKNGFPKEPSTEIIEIEEEEYLDIIFPVKIREKREQYIVRFLFNQEHVEEEIAMMEYQIALIGLLGAILGILLTFFLLNQITKPIKLLLRSVRKISTGDLSSDVPIIAQDDIGELSMAFNQMRKDLSESFDELIETQENLKELNRSLEEKVQERTQELEEKNEELKRLSITDKLTGLFNRVKLDETLEKEYERFKRYKHSFGVILLDIDYFKSVNDTHGHHVGDQVLVETAKLLKNSIRETDIIGRWGGEEFMIICPEINKEGAIKVADKVRHVMETYEFPVIKNKTASFGVSICNESDIVDTLTARADAALYEAKKRGRNRVEYK